MLTVAPTLPASLNYLVSLGADSLEKKRKKERERGREREGKRECEKATGKKKKREERHDTQKKKEPAEKLFNAKRALEGRGGWERVCVCVCVCVWERGSDAESLCWLWPHEATVSDLMS